MAPPHILCFAPYTNWSIHSARQVTILQALRLRGCSVTYVACDAAFPTCDMTQAANGAAIPPGPQACLTCQSSVAARLAAWGMPYRWLGRWLTTADTVEAARWAADIPAADLSSARYDHSADDRPAGEAWEIGAWVRSTVHTHLRHNVLDLGDAETARVYRAYLTTGLLACFGLSRLMAAERPRAQLLFNGRMSAVRVALELGLQRGIRTICEERSVVAGRLTLYDNANCLDLTAADKLWHDWRDVPLTPTEVADVGALLVDRWRGRSTDVSAFSAGLEDATAVCTRLRLDAHRPLWVLFTSSIDETVDEPRSAGAFASQADWIAATLAYVRAYPEIQLVIRVHPNSGSKRSLGQNTQDARFFSDLARTLPDNARLVPGEDETSSYTLAAIADLGLVWYSTIGLEMAAIGKTVVRAGASWLAHADFMIAIESPAAYAASLDAARAPVPQELARTRTAGAWRFAHAWYFRQSIAFPLVAQPKWFVGEMAYRDVGALAPGKDLLLDRICDTVMTGAPLHDAPGGRSGDAAAEWAAITAQLGELRA